MSIYEYDEEKHMRQTRAEGYEAGEAAGMIKGEAIGIQKGEISAMERLNRLNRLLAEQKRTDDIVKAASDPEYQKRLLEEFGLF
ncbi:hypothetical protein [Faecalicatena contorta]